MSIRIRPFQPSVDTRKPFDCGKADLNGFLCESVADTPNAKRRYSYPALKIGRLAVCKQSQHTGLGKDILDLIKIWFFHDSKARCRYLTVDAYLDAEDFYTKCEFRPLTIPEADDETVLMFFDLKGITTKHLPA